MTTVLVKKLINKQTMKLLTILAVFFIVCSSDLSAQENIVVNMDSRIENVSNLYIELQSLQKREKRVQIAIDFDLKPS